MRTPSPLTLVAAALASLLVPAVTAAQVLGPFPWQMQPYCNVVTLTLVNTPAGGWTLDGNDDQCGAVNRGSAVGVATFNQSGNVTLNFSIVTAPAGRPVHVSAVVSPATGSGTWSDSAGNAGTFAFFGSTPGLPARPAPASGLPSASITTVEIAPGTVGASDINTAEVQARIGGTCTGNQAMTGVAADGSVTCVAVPSALNPIVMTQNASDFDRLLSTTTPTTVLPVAHLFAASGDGPVSMGLTAPASIGGVSYRLSAVEYCITQAPTNGAFVTAAVVYHETAGAPGWPLSVAVSDSTDRTTAGCYTLSVPALNPRGYGLTLGLAGQSTSLTSAGIVLSSVRTTWVPVTP